MEKQFWLNRWEENQIGFHMPKPNPLLVKHFSQMNVGEGKRVFVPLCGKTLDVGWFLQQGKSVVGVELSEKAIEELFQQLGLEPSIMEHDGFKKYSAPKIDICVGDFFAMTADDFGPVDVIYDRAALIAMPPEMRNRYTAHLVNVTAAAPQFLITLEYDEALHQGPPFCVPQTTVEDHYEAQYHIKHVTSETLKDGLKGKYPATDHVYFLEAI